MGGASEAPREGEAPIAVMVQPLRSAFVGDAGDTLWALWGAGLFVVCLAMANVAGLRLVRTVQRSRELAIRLALGRGGDRWRASCSASR